MANKNDPKTWAMIKEVVDKSNCSKLSSALSHNDNVLSADQSIANAGNDFFGWVLWTNVI